MITEIELSDYNPYQNAQIVVVEDDIMEMEFPDYAYQKSENDVYYTPLRGEKLTDIAYKYWDEIVPNAGKYWWVIAYANDIVNPLDESEYVGKEVLIPDILQFKLIN